METTSSSSVKRVIRQTIVEATAVIQSLDALEPALLKAVEIVVQSLRSGHKILTCGNGGSAADASHLATELVCRYCTERRPYPAISLVDGGSTLTAIGNDYSFDQLFARQVQAFGQSGDVLVCFTTSGQSKNVITAMEQARQMDLRIISFLGRSGGAAKGLSDVELIVPATQSTGRIQEAHQILYHIICQLMDMELGHMG